MGVIVLQSGNGKPFLVRHELARSYFLDSLLRKIRLVEHLAGDQSFQIHLFSQTCRLGTLQGSQASKQEIEAAERD